MAAAAGTVKKVFLELGGKSAFVVLDDADLASACGTAAFMVCTHAGQGCAITTRLIVPRGRFDEAVDLTAATLNGLAAGDPLDPGTVCGPLISERQRDRVERYIGLVAEEGGSIVVGGGRPADQPKGFFVEPTLAVGLGQDSRVVREEIFGPVLVVSPHDGDDDAVRSGQRFFLRPVRLGVVRGPRPGHGRGRSSADGHGGGQRRCLVQPRHPLRGLQAVGDRAGDGCGRLRGVSRDQVDRRAGMSGERRPPKPDRARGMEKMQEVYNFTVDPENVPGDFVAYTVDHLFGDVWCRPDLAVPERRLLTIGVLAALGKTDLLDVQFSSALANGELTEDQVREIVVHLVHYIGWPLATDLSAAAERVIARRQT